MRQILLTVIVALMGVGGVYGQHATGWTFPAKSGIHSSPATDGSTVYFGSNDSIFYALDRKDGALKWKHKTNGQIRSKPSIYKESVIINSSDGNLYSFHKQSGDILWVFKTGGEKVYDVWDYYLSSPTLSENTIYVGSGDGFVYAIDAETGKQRWSYDTGDIVHATAVVSDQVVYIGSFNGYFYALDSRSGRLIWEFRTIGDSYFPKGEIQRGGVIYNNSIIFGSRDFNIYALDIKTGRGLWNMKEKGSWVIATPLHYGDNIFFGTSDTHRFYSMNATTGEIVWSLPLTMRVYSTAVSFNDKIYFGCFNGKLFGVNPKTGEIEYTFQTPASKENYTTIYKENGEFRDDFELYGPETNEIEKRILGLGSILSDPLIEEGVAYFGDSKGIFHALPLP